MVNIHKTRFRTWTSGGGGSGGGGGMDIKVKVSATDTTTDYLSNKLVSTDGTATFTILNPAANEQYDISVGGVTNITVAQGQNLIATTSVVPNALYLVTDAYSNTCQIFIWGVSTSSFDEQGFGLFTNTNTPTPVNALMKYNISVDKVTEVYVPVSNFRLVQSYDINTSSSIGNVVDVFPLNSNFFCHNSSIEDSTLAGGFLSSFNLTIQSSQIKSSILNISNNLWGCLNSTIIGGTIIGNGSSSQDCTLVYCNINYAQITSSNNGCAFFGSTFSSNSQVICSGLVGCDVNNCYFGEGSTTTLADSTITRTRVWNNATLTLAGSTFVNCNIGISKTVVPAIGYNATNASIEDLDSTFEVFLNPNLAGVMDMVNDKFAGIVRIGTSGVPASWDLKQINNFPTDHIFSIIPADSNTVDIYDAGAGGNNIYLNVAAVVTYDGTKDDTLVVRSGLNDSTRLFQIGGWQAPSA